MGYSAAACAGMLRLGLMISAFHANGASFPALYVLQMSCW